MKNINGYPQMVSASRPHRILNQYSENTGRIIDIDKYLSSVKKTIDNLDRLSLAKLVAAILETYKKNGVIYVFGNGGSGANASHFAGDFVKGVSCGLDKRFKAICLNDNMPAFMAIANDISYEDVFVEQLKNFLTQNDLVIGISGSGNSSNIVKALEYGNTVGATTVAICGFKGGKIKQIAKLSVHAEVDDMEVSEDLHIIICHCVKRVITNKLHDVKNIRIN